MKNFFIAALLCSSVLLSGCTTVAPEAGEEGVKVHKPWFFGTGGIDMTPVETGLEYTWLSTDYVIVNMLPRAYDEDLEMKKIVSHQQHAETHVINYLLDQKKYLKCCMEQHDEKPQ